MAWTVDVDHFPLSIQLFFVRPCKLLQSKEREERSSPQPPERDFGAREKRIVKSAALAKRERDTGRQICRWAGCTRCGGG